jgi:Holliday junction resolvase-like predicted endonuclease
LGPRSTIDSVSLACANSSAAHLLRARRSEKRVAEYFLKQKHLLLFHNKKIAGVEIDLVFWDRSGNIIFVEVKSLSRRGLMPYRLTKAQTDRLYKAKTFFESIYQFSVEVRLVMVNTAQEELIDLVIL